MLVFRVNLLSVGKVSVVDAKKHRAPNKNTIFKRFILIYIDVAEITRKRSKQVDCKLEQLILSECLYLYRVIADDFSCSSRNLY